MKEGFNSVVLLLLRSPFSTSVRCSGCFIYTHLFSTLTALNLCIVQQIFLYCSLFNLRTGDPVKCCWFPCTVKMVTLVEPALLLLVWQSVWALDIPLEGESVT